MSRGFNLTAEINLRGPSNIRTVVADIRRQLGTVTADVNVRVNPTAIRNISALNQALGRLNTTLADTNRLGLQATNTLNSLANAGRQATNSIANLPRNIQNASTAVNRLSNTTNQAARNLQVARTEFEEFGRQSALAIRRFAAFATVTGAIFKVTNAISSASAEFIAFNKELVRVAQVTDTSVSNLGGLVKEITSLSTRFGVTSKELIQVSSTLAQAGLSARDTEKALKALALSAMAPSFDSLNDTVEGSIALMRQFNIGAKDLEKALGSVNAVSAKFAVEASDIITAIQRTGGVFAAASRGVSEGTDALNQFIAVFTSVRATTRESAETIATGLRTIFTRVQRASTIDALKEYGVVLTDLEGKFVGPYEAVRKLAEGLNQLDPRDLRFSRIVEELGGFRQIGKVIPLIQQFATAQQALIVAQKGQGSLANDAATAQQALAVKISKVREEFIALIRSVGQSDSFQNFVKLSLDLASALIKVADSAKGVLPALTAIAAIRGASFLTQFATGFAGGLRRRNSGGPIMGFAKGGLVPGSGNSDTVPAMLTPGEFVIRKKAVESLGVSRLSNINKYANGGPAKSPTKTLEKYYTDSSKINLGLANSKSLSKEDRKSLASDVKNLRQLRAQAPTQVYSAISSVAFDSMARQTGFNKKAAEGAGPLKEDRVFAAETQKIIGKAFKLPGFLSTSKEYSVAKMFLDNAPRTDNFGAMLNIKTKQGAKGIDTVSSLGGKQIDVSKTEIDPRSGKPTTYKMNQPDAEKEVILQPRSRFKIDKASFSGFLGGNKNLWMDVQQFNEGGLIEDIRGGLRQVGAAVLEPNSKRPKSDVLFSVTENKIKNALGLDKQESIKNLGFSNRLDMTGIVSGLTTPTSDTFNAALDNGIVQGINSAAAQISEKLQVSIGSIDDSTKNAFLSGINTGTRGNLFEDILTLMSGKFERISGRNFDFPNGMPSIKEGDFAGLPKKWIDAKASFGRATRSGEGSLESKTINQIRDEINKQRSKYIGLADKVEDKPQKANEDSLLSALKTKYSDRDSEAFKALNGSDRYAVEEALSTNKVSKNKLNKFRSLLGMATGGSISGEDTVPALLTPGEFVINKKAASRIGSAKLHQLNKADKLQGFNKGGPVGGFYRFARGGSAPGDYTANLEGAVQRAFQDFEGFMKTFGDMVNSRRDALYKLNRQSGMSAADAKQNADLRARGEGAQYLADRGVIRQGVATGLSRTLNPSGPEAQAGARFIVQSMQKAAQASQQVAQNSSRTAGFFDKLKNTASSVTSSVGGFLNKIRGANLTPEQRQDRRDRRQSIANLGMAATFAIPMLADQIGNSIGGTKGAGVAGAGASFGTAVGVGSQFGPYGALVGAIAGTVMAVDGYNQGIAEKEKELSQQKIESETKRIDSSLQQVEKNPQNAAATTAVVASLQKIAGEEEKVMSANRKLRQPTTLQKIGSYFGYETGKSTEDIAQENTAANKAASDVAMQLLTSKVNSGMGFDAALASTGNAALVKEQIAQGAGGEFAIKEARLREVRAKFEGKTDSTSKEIVANLDKALQENTDAAFASATAGLKAADADIQRAKAAKAVAKALNLASVSIDRTFSNMESAISKASAQLSMAGEDLDAIASGKISTKARFSQQNVLENPNAYSSAERSAAVQQAGGLFGRDLSFVTRLTEVGANIKNTMTRMGVDAQQSGKPKEMVAEEIQRTVDKQLRDAFGDNNLSRQISEQLKLALQNQLVDKESKEIDLDKLMSETTGLTSLLEAEKKAYKALADAAKLATDSINLYSEQIDKANAMLNEVNSMRGDSIATKASNDFRLTEVLGDKVGLRDRFGARLEEGAARAGVKPGQFNLPALQARLAQLSNNATGVQQNRDQFQQNNQLTDPKTIQGIANFNRSLSSLNNDIENTKKAIKDLPKDIQGFIDDTFSELQKKVSEFETKQQAGASFGEKLVTSTPQELLDLNNTYNLVNNTLNGQVRTIQQSIAAQQAYAKTINDGGNAMDAMNAAQNAFASENRAAFSMFSELISVAGIEKPQANQMRADFLETMAKSQGMNLQNNPLLNTIIANLRQVPQDDPEVARLKTLYQELQKAQQQAAEAARQIVVDDATKLITAAGDAVKKAIETARISFNEQQLNDVGLGISRPVDVMTKSKGGVVYASNGKFIPRGTDTVPAMLTPGEFVVNAKSASSHLPLLNAINKSKGGMVQYLEDGGPAVGSPMWRYNKAREMFGPTHRITMREGAAAGLNLNSLGNQIDPYLANNRTGNVSSSQAQQIVDDYSTSAAQYNTTNGFRNGLSTPVSGKPSRASVLPNNANFSTRLFANAADFGEGAYGIVKDVGGALRTGAGAVGRGIYGAASSVGDYFGRLRTFANAPYAGDDVAGGLWRTGVRAVRGASYIGYTGTRGLIRGLQGSNLGGGLATAGAGMAVDYALGSMGASEGLRSTASAAIDAGSTLQQGTQIGMGAAASARILAEMGIQSAYEVGSAVYDTKAYIDKKLEEGDAQQQARNDYGVVGGIGSNILGNIFGTDASIYRPGTWIPGRGIPAAIGRVSVNTGDAIKANQQAADTKKSVEAKQAEMNAQFPMLMEDGQTRNIGVLGEQWVRRRVELEKNKKKLTETEYQRQLAILNQDRDAVDVTKGWFSNTTTRRMSASNTDLDHAYKQEMGRMESEQAEAKQKAETQQAQQMAKTAERMYAAGAQAAETVGNFASNMWNSAVNTYNGWVKDSKDKAAARAEAQRIEKDNQTSASATRYIKHPAVPSLIESNNQLAAERSAKLARLMELNEPVNLVDKAQAEAEKEKRQQEKERLLKEINSINTQIVDSNMAVYAKTPSSEINAEWDAYNKNQAKLAKKAEMEKIRENKIAQNRAIEKEMGLRNSLAKATGLPMPRDPERMADWRAKVLKKIESKFYLSGDTAKDIELMSSYGMKPELAKEILQPMTDAQKDAIFSVMSNQTSGGLAKYSENDLKLLKMSKDDIIKQRLLAEQKYGTDSIAAANNEQRRQELEKARQKEFGKASKQIGRFDALAQRGAMGSPGQQKAIQNNLFKKMIKAGYIDPSMSAEENAQRLSALNMNANTVSFLYPNQTGGMLAMKKARGGIVYAAEGQLINFQPQGTDTVPAMLTPGEFVVNAKSTQKHLPLLKAINKQKGGKIGYYDAGGTVDSSLLRNQQASTNASNMQNQAIRSIYNQTSVINKRTSVIDNTSSSLEQSVKQNYNNTDKDLNRIQNIANETLSSSEATRSGLTRTGYFNQGGVVYASNGMLIPYRPRGTDTVPAMLTPGEFVVNKQSTAQNLPLLTAINNGNTSFMSKGGKVNYMAGGGLLGQILGPMSNSFVLLTESIKLSVKALQDYQRQLASTQPNSVSTNSGSGPLAGLDGLGQFVVKFDQFIAAVNSINLPPVISLQVAPIQVNITGAEALTQALEGPMGEMLHKQISSAFGRLSTITEGALPG
jgi:glutaredoxin 2